MPSEFLTIENDHSIGFFTSLVEISGVDLENDIYSTFEWVPDFSRKQKVEDYL